MSGVAPDFLHEVATADMHDITALGDLATKLRGFVFTTYETQIIQVLCVNLLRARIRDLAAQESAEPQETQAATEEPRGLKRWVFGNQKQG